ncbi:MAG: queuosine precursor transporter [Candidatus Aenigmarchaeota archaeon]|nr:queuosine precursor transporter [Candidatus Aenigmarchaeota archaeon]
MNLKFTKEEKTSILLGIFVAAIVSGNLLGTKIFSFWVISASVGIFMYPLTFLITDIIEEVYGREKTKQFIVAGFFSLLLIIFFTLISIYLPPASRYELDSEYFKVFAPSLRIIIASIIGFLISQYHDIMAFEFWKNKTRGRFLWLRNNASTIVSQFLDTTIFMFIAFYMVTPQFTVDFVFALIMPYWILKVFVALCDTPLCYLGVRWLKNSK